MTPEPNPYQSPLQHASDALTGEPCQPSHFGSAVPADFRKRIVKGRWAIPLIGLVFALIAALSLCMFVYQGLFRLPTGERLVLIAPFSVLAHLIRAIVLAILAWQLWRYSASIKEIGQGSDAAVDQFLDRHASLWVWGAVALLVMIGYAIFYVVWVAMSAFERIL